LAGPAQEFLGLDAFRTWHWWNQDGDELTSQILGQVNPVRSLRHGEDVFALDASSGSLFRLWREEGGGEIRVETVVERAVRAVAPVAGRQDALWIVVDDQLRRISVSGTTELRYQLPLATKLTRFELGHPSRGSESDFGINCVTEDHLRRLWLGTTAGLYLADPQRATPVQFPRDPASQHQLETAVEEVNDRLAHDNVESTSPIPLIEKVVRGLSLPQQTLPGEPATNRRFRSRFGGTAPCADSRFTADGKVWMSFGNLLMPPCDLLGNEVPKLLRVESRVLGPLNESGTYFGAADGVVCAGNGELELRRPELSMAQLARRYLELLDAENLEPEQVIRDSDLAALQRRLLQTLDDSDELWRLIHREDPSWASGLSQEYGEETLDRLEEENELASQITADLGPDPLQCFLRDHLLRQLDRRDELLDVLAQIPGVYEKFEKKYGAGSLVDLGSRDDLAERIADDLGPGWEVLERWAFRRSRLTEVLGSDLLVRADPAADGEDSLCIPLLITQRNQGFLEVSRERLSAEEPPQAPYAVESLRAPPILLDSIVFAPREREPAPYQVLAPPWLRRARTGTVMYSEGLSVALGSGEGFPVGFQMLPTGRPISASRSCRLEDGSLLFQTTEGELLLDQGRSGTAFQRLNESGTLQRQEIVNAESSTQVAFMMEGSRVEHFTRCSEDDVRRPRRVVVASDVGTSAETKPNAPRASPSTVPAWVEVYSDGSNDYDLRAILLDEGGDGALLGFWDANQSLVAVSKDRVESIALPGASGKPDGNISSAAVRVLFRDHERRVWVGSRDNLWIRETPENGKAFRPWNEKQPFAVGVRAIAEYPAGRLWFSAELGGIWTLDTSDDKETPKRVPFELPEDGPVRAASEVPAIRDPRASSASVSSMPTSGAAQDDSAAGKAEDRPQALTHLRGPVVVVPDPSTQSAHHPYRVWVGGDKLTLVEIDPCTQEVENHTKQLRELFFGKRMRAGNVTCAAAHGTDLILGGDFGLVRVRSIQLEEEPTLELVAVPAGINFHVESSAAKEPDGTEASAPDSDLGSRDAPVGERPGSPKCNCQQLIRMADGSLVASVLSENRVVLLKMGPKEEAFHFLASLTMPYDSRTDRFDPYAEESKPPVQLAVQGERLFVATNRGSVYAITGDRQLEKLWEMQVRPPLRSVALRVPRDAMDTRPIEWFLLGSGSPMIYRSRGYGDFTSLGVAAEAWMRAAQLASDELLLVHDQGLSLLRESAAGRWERKKVEFKDRATHPVWDIAVQHDCQGKTPPLYVAAGKQLWQLVAYLGEKPAVLVPAGGQVDWRVVALGELPSLNPDLLRGRSVLAADGTHIWFGTPNGLYWCNIPSRNSAAPLDWKVCVGLPSCRVTGIIPLGERGGSRDGGSSSDQVLVLTDSGRYRGAWHGDRKEGWWSFEPLQVDGIQGNQVQALSWCYTDKGRAALIGTDQGLAVAWWKKGDEIRADNATWSHRKGSVGLLSDQVSCVYFHPPQTNDPRNLVWVGTAEGVNIFEVGDGPTGLSWDPIDNGTCSVKDGLPKGNVTAIRCTPDRKRAWLVVQIPLWEGGGNQLVLWDRTDHRVVNPVPFLFSGVQELQIGPVKNDGKAPHVLVRDEANGWSIWDPADYRQARLDVKNSWFFWEYATLRLESLNGSSIAPQQEWFVNHLQKPSKLGRLRWPNDFWKPRQQSLLARYRDGKGFTYVAAAARPNLENAVVRFVRMILVFGIAVAGSAGITWAVTKRIRRRRARLRQQNPYVVGPPIKNPAQCFGREELLALVESSVSKVNWALVGEYRIGKTTLQYILKQRLEARDDPGRIYLPVFVDLQYLADMESPNLFFLLGHALVVLAKEKLPSEEVAQLEFQRQGDEQRYTARALGRDAERIVQGLQRHLSRQPHIVLQIDEIQLLDRVPYDSLSGFRALLVNNEAISAVLSGVKMVKGQDRGSPWWNVFKEIPVLPLTYSEARRLVIEPARGLFRFENAAVERILSLSEYKPMGIQQLCHDILGYKYAQHRYGRISEQEVFEAQKWGRKQAEKESPAGGKKS